MSTMYKRLFIRINRTLVLPPEVLLNVRNILLIRSNYYILIYPNYYKLNDVNKKKKLTNF